MTLNGYSSLGCCQICEHDGLGTSKEWIRNLNLEGLGALNNRYLSLKHKSLSSFFILHLADLGSNFLGLLSNLVASLLELVILVVDYFLEGKGLLGITVTSESVKDFWKLRLTNDRVLHLTDVLISEDNVGLVNTEFEGEEQDRECDLVTLADLNRLHLAEVGLGNS